MPQTTTIKQDLSQDGFGFGGGGGGSVDLSFRASCQNQTISSMKYGYFNKVKHHTNKLLAFALKDASLIETNYVKATVDA